MDEQAHSGEERTLSVRLDLQLAGAPTRGRLRTDGGAEEHFVGWLGFVDALKRLYEFEVDRETRKPRAMRREQDVHPHRKERH
jgi:hypothetical protein